jgi:hypothetical protein
MATMATPFSHCLLAELLEKSVFPILHNVNHTFITQSPAKHHPISQEISTKRLFVSAKEYLPM